MKLYNQVLAVSVIKDDMQAKELLWLNRAAIAQVYHVGWRGWVLTRVFEWRCRSYLKKYGSK